MCKNKIYHCFQFFLKKIALICLSFIFITTMPSLWMARLIAFLSKYWCAWLKTRTKGLCSKIASSQLSNLQFWQIWQLSILAILATFATFIFGNFQFWPFWSKNFESSPTRTTTTYKMYGSCDQKSLDFSLESNQNTVLTNKVLYQSFVSSLW